MKLGPEGALTGALAALDIALWDLKGKATGLPIYKLIGGAWRTALPFYASIGGNGERSLDEVLRVVEARLKDQPAAIKIRFDNDRTLLDADIPGDIAKARAVRKLVGDALPAGVRCQQRLHDRRRHPRGPRAGGTRLLVVRGAGAALPRQGDGRGRARAGHHRLGRRADLHAGRRWPT